MNRYTACFGVLALMLLMAEECRADIILIVDKVHIPAGQTAVVGVYATSNSGDILNGFNLPLDVNNDGTRSLPTGFSYDPQIITNAIFANTGYDTPPSAALAGVDAIPTGSGSNIALSSVPTKLFDLRIRVDASVSAGTVVPLSIKVPSSPLSSLFNIAGFANGNLASGKPTVLTPSLIGPAVGSITITGVPEPACLALLALSVVGATGWAKRKRRMGQPSAG